MNSTHRRRRRLRRPAHSTVVAYLALFLALTTGGAWAASQIGANGIKNNAILSRHIKNGQVHGRDLGKGSVSNSKLAANAVTSGKVKNGSLATGDLANNAVTATKLADNAVTTTKLADNAVTTTKLADNAVTTTKLADNAVTGAKVSDNSLTGNDIDESTLGQVPNAATLAGKLPTAFLASTVYKKESAVVAGTRLGDNTNVISVSCDPGDILLSGGPANVNAASKLLESFPAPGTTNGWQARINDNGTADTFSVVLLCVNQTP